jgi:hypothetical protein
VSDEPDERDGAQAPPEPYFGSMIEWFERWLRPAYRRSTHGDLREWCEEWWRHAEALSRIDALWRAWEALRLDPGTGLSVWWRDHADHHLAVLLDADGPFKGCGDGHIDDSPELLRHTQPPTAMFASEHDQNQPPSPIPTGARQQGTIVEPSPRRHAEQRPTIDRSR